MTPAIILSAHTMALGVARALSEMGVPVIVVHYAPLDFAQFSRYVSESIIAPHPKENEAAFVESVIKLSNRWKDAILFPASDETLLVSARHKEQFSRHFRIACPDFATVHQVVDKRQTYPIAAAVGVPTPKTLLPTSEEDLREFGQTIDYPCLLKPAQSHLFFERFRKKMFIADDLNKLIYYYKQTRDVGLDMMVQEIIPGADKEVVNYNVYAHAGRPLVEFTADHVRSAPPRWGSPCVARSRVIPELLEPGRRLIEALDYTGFACVEFKRDHRDGLYKLMEVNGRHNLSTSLAVRCGINFPWMEYQYLCYGKVPQQKDYEEDIYWIDMTRDITSSIRNLFCERYSLATYLRSYLSPKVWAIFDWSDLKPFRKRILSLVITLVKRDKHAVTSSTVSDQTRYNNGSPP